MRVLIASKRSPNRPGRRNGGVQTWIATVAAELRRLGHDVLIVDQLSRDITGTYDLGIFANWQYVAQFRSCCVRVINVVHGIVSDEAPTSDAIQTVYTSEEVRDHWGGDEPIVRQPIDLDFWKPIASADYTHPGAFLVRYAARKGLDHLPAVAQSLGMPFIHLQKAAPEHALITLQRAAVVVASGRCAVEAMACGVPVVICDDRSYQGPLLDLSAIGAMRRNYSGRGGVTPTPQALCDVIDQSRTCGSANRKHVEKFHDVKTVVQQLLSI